jgi:hypothetical protein
LQVNCAHKQQPPDCFCMAMLCPVLLLSCRDPDDKQIARELRALKALIKEEQTASGKVFKGAFGAAPKPTPNGTTTNSSSGGGAGTAAAAAAGGAGVAAAAAAAVSAAAVGGAANAEISEAAADNEPVSKRTAAAAAATTVQGRDWMALMQPLMAVAGIFIAFVVFMLTSR